MVPGGSFNDLRAQIVTAPELSPFRETSPVAGVFLPSAEVDAVMGLLHLRELHTFLTLPRLQFSVWLAASRRVSAGKGYAMKPELSSVPRLAPGVRLNDKNAKSRMLLMPERALQLNGPSFEIVQLCDGKHTIQQIAEKLHALYNRAEPQRITEDLLGYLVLLHDQRAIDF